MKLCMISFTKKGMQLSKRIQSLLIEQFQTEGAERELPIVSVSLYTKCSAVQKEAAFEGVLFVEESISLWAKEQMEQQNALLFIGACGIAVRAVAEHLKGKLTDAPVLVMDEAGNYVIPLLSGHMGGANALAVRLAEQTRALPVITTATDLNQTFAVDIFAKRNGLTIVNKEGIAAVSAKLLEEGRITMSAEGEKADGTEEIQAEKGIVMTAYPPKHRIDVIVSSTFHNEKALLMLKPKQYVIGIGCRRGKTENEISVFIESVLKELGITEEDIYMLASIENKKREEGILAWSSKRGIPFVTYTAQQLGKVEGSFTGSSFVKKSVGVENVCERAALLACVDGGRLVLKKRAKDGMTIAAAIRKWRLNFDET